MWLYLINTDFGDWISFGENRTYLRVVLFSSTSFFYALDVSIIVPFSNMTWSKPCDIIVLLIYKRDFTACLTLVKQQPLISFLFVFFFLYTAMKSEKINKWKHLSLLRMFQILMPILYTTEIWKITQICPTCPNWRFLNLSGVKLFSREKCALLRPDTMSGTWILLEAQRQGLMSYNLIHISSQWINPTRSLDILVEVLLCFRVTTIQFPLLWEPSRKS